MVHLRQLKKKTPFVGYLLQDHSCAFHLNKPRIEIRFRGRLSIDALT